MTNQEVLELLERFERSSLYTMKLSTGVFSLELSRGAGTQFPAPVQPEPQAMAEADAGDPLSARRRVLCRAGAGRRAVCARGTDGQQGADALPD